MNASNLPSPSGPSKTSTPSPDAIPISGGFPREMIRRNLTDFPASASGSSESVICGQSISHAPENSESIKAKGPITYFVQGGEFVKIGRTRNLKARLAALQVSNPFRLSVIKTTVAISESDAHKYAATLTDRKASEWFGLTPKLTEWIESLEHAEPPKRPAKPAFQKSVGSLTPQVSPTASDRRFITMHLGQFMSPEQKAWAEREAAKRGIQPGEFLRQTINLAASKQLETA